MAYDLTGRSLTPLADLIDAADFPLADFLPVDLIAQVFDGLYYTEAYSAFDGENLVLSVRLAWEGALELAPPGCDAFSLVIASAGEQWTSVAASIVLGPDFALRFEDLTAGLRFPEHVLRDVATDGPAEIEVAGDITISPSGIVLENATGATLAPAYVAGTEVIVEAADVRPVFGPIDPPGWLGEAPDFQGVTFEKLSVRIPGEYLQTDAGADLDIEMTQAAIGTTGFTGRVALASADLDHPVTGQLFGFDFRFRRFTLEVVENGLVEASLGVDLHLDVFDTATQEKWIAADVAFDAAGDFTAALAPAAEQPGEADGEAGALVTMEYAGAAKFLIRGARLTREGELWSIYLTGALRLLIDGAVDWPEIAFDEVGVRSDGRLLLPEGGGITFASPLVVEWHFVRLAVPKFRFGRPEGEPNKLQIALSAEIALIEGLPAGASVEGLTITWAPGDDAPPDVAFTGIGVRFGAPGVFRAELEVSYTQAAGVIEFRGHGALELTALDMGIEIGVIVGYNQPADFSFLYLFADAKLLPTGIPIGQTGLSIYGFQGLIAYNMALDINAADPVDERYYNLFVKNPIGITHVDKWAMSEGDNALGVGIVLGTADKGFAFNVKGLLVVAFPDLTLLLQCKANFVKLKPDLSTSSEGTLDALMVYQAGAGALTFDIVAYWGMPGLVEVTGAARAYFNFTDPGAWYLMIGQDEDGKRVAAHALRWGDKWLFSGGFWFRLDGTGVVTGILIEVSLRAEAGGFWVEAYGRARGEMRLFWEPPQWEGSLLLSGRVAAGYHGLSVGLSLSGHADARVRRPTQVRIAVEACFKALFWSVCKSHTFKWELPQMPQLEAPIRPWSARPGLWTSALGTGGGAAGGTAELDTATVSLAQGQVPTVPPHSILSLDFAKSMSDATGRFNEAVGLPNGGFLTIGDRSNYSAAYRLDRVALIRDPDGAAEEFDLWGAWAQETLHPNTTLRLMSSERFGHDGSLSESFVDGVDLDYCAEPEDAIVCVPLSGIEPGFGWLPDGSLYHWGTESGEEPGGESGEEPDGGADRTGPRLQPGDRVTIIPVTPVDDVTGRTGEPPEPGEPKPPEPPEKPDHGETLPGGLTQWVVWFCELSLCRALVLPLAALLIAAIVLLLVLTGALPNRVGEWIALFAVVIAALLLFLLCLCRGLRRRDTPGSAQDDGPGRGPEDDAGDEPNGGRTDDGSADDGSAGDDRSDGGGAAGGGAGDDREPGRGDGPGDGAPADPDRGGRGAGGGGGDSGDDGAHGDDGGGRFTPDRGPNGEIVIDHGHAGDEPLRELCYKRGHAPPEFVQGHRRATIITVRESWTVPADARILPPNELFELRVEHTARLKAPNGSISQPLGASVPVTRRFRTSGPPAYPGALADYIAGRYPLDGQRPVYRGYDLAIRFREAYVPYLYTSVGQQLVVRLFDAAGDPVRGEDGEPLLVPATRAGAIERTRTETTWETAVLRDRDCVMAEYVGPPQVAENTLVVAPGGLDLAANVQYFAELVADADPDTALASWTFTTSSFTTFTELVSLDRRVARPRVAAAAPAAAEFDAAARQLGLPTIGYVDRFTVTPFVTLDHARCVALVLEAPEPLEVGLRLTVRVDGAAADVVANVDETRAIVVPAGGGDWPAASLPVSLSWLRDPGGGDELRRAVDGDTTGEVVAFDVDAGG